MAIWLFVLDDECPPETFRLEIWEEETCSLEAWPGADDDAPSAGDSLYFFHAASKCDDPGFSGLAVVTEVEDGTRKGGPLVHFRPAPPHDTLKMYPWGSDDALEMADDICGDTKRGSLHEMDKDEAEEVRDGIQAWISGRYCSMEDDD